MPAEQDVPEALVIAPSGPHKNTFVLLHGRGRKPSIFAGEMAPLQQAFPHAKFIFPQAPKQRATVYRKRITRQWFDDWHLSPDLQSTDVVHSRYDEGLQTSGLGETVTYLHSLVTKESLLVGGAQNVVLGGFSQGAAASLVASLLWDGEQRLGGVVAMCAWLPYMRQMSGILQRSNDEGKPNSTDAEQQIGDEVDLFERTPSEEKELGQGIDDIQAVLEWLREQIDLPQKRSTRLRMNEVCTPVMFLHGLNDEKVAPERSQKALQFLCNLGLDSVERKTYSGVGHESSDRMKADVVTFLQAVLPAGAKIT